MGRKLLRLLGVVAVLALLASACGDDGGTPAAGEDPDELIPIRIPTLTFPSLTAVLPPLIEAQGIGERHGFDVQVERFGDVGALHAAATVGSIDAVVGGPNVLHQHAEEGAAIKAVATYAGLKSMLVITGDPEIQSVEDLRGRSIAATLASAEYQILSIYALSKGIDLTEDATLVNAAPPEVRTQLEAGRVDAGLVWEPGATLALAGGNFEIVLRGDQAWEDLTGQKGWELLWGMQEEYLQTYPEVVEPFVAMLQEAVEFMHENPEVAGEVMEEATGMPAEAFMDVLEQGRIDYDVRPAWEDDVRPTIERHWEEALEHGFAETLPDDDFIYDPSA